MTAIILETPQAAEAAHLIADDISQYAYKSWDELFSVPRPDVEAFQLRSARRRFEALVPRVAALKDQSDHSGTTRIDTLNDLVPLLFNHTVHKSYPLSLLEKNRFEMLTRWLQRLTTIDLSGVNVGHCESVDDWMTKLEAQTPLQLFHTSGTSGKISFIPRTTLERDLWAHTFLRACGGGFGNEPYTPLGGSDGTRLPVIFPSVRHGRYVAQRMVRHLSEVVAPSPDQCYTLSEGSLSADLVSLSGRIRIAQAKGEMAQFSLSDRQRLELKLYMEAQSRRPQETANFFSHVSERLRGQRVLLFSPTSYLYQASAAGLARNLSNVFAADSVGVVGGGGKDVQLPGDWFDQVKDFTGIPHWTRQYGMTELTGVMPSCPQGRFHLHPTIVPFLLDPESGAVLPRQGTQTGRFAALDLLAQSNWGGIISSDKVTIEWDSACPCGRKGAFIHDGIERYASNVTGDDKVNCASTVDNTDTALQALLA